MKITIIQKGMYLKDIVFTCTFERETEREILDIIKEFSENAKTYDSTYLTYEIED